MSQFNYPNYGQTPPDPRSRRSSNASVNKYTPEQYGGPPAAPPGGYAAPPPPAQGTYNTAAPAVQGAYTAPPPQAQGNYMPPTQPNGPAVGSQPIPIIQPIPQNNVYGTSPASYTSANGNLHPAAAASMPTQPPYPSTSYDREAARRQSHSSTRSHHSHPARQSQESHHSRHSGRSSHSRPREDRRRHSDYEDVRRDRERERESHGGRRHSDYADIRREREKEKKREAEEEELRLKRQKTHRPTWGDSIFSVFGVVKDALGPRDKY